MLCSFQKPEPWQPVYQWAAPQVPSPDECDDEEVLYTRIIQDSKSSPNAVRIFQERLDVSSTFS